MKVEPTTRKIKSIISDLNSGKLVIRPSFQRRLVWTPKDRVFFIDTILRGYSFPEIYIADGEINVDTAESVQLVVDGQQRLSAIYDYFNGDVKIPKGSDIVAYKDLETTEKEKFLTYSVSVRDLANTPEEEIIEIFSRINKTSYNLNGMEINNAVYTGEFITLAQDLSGLSFFEKYPVFTSGDVKRMRDVEFLLLLICTMIEGYFNRISVINDYLEKYNEEFPQGREIKERFKQVTGIIDDAEIDTKRSLWKKVSFFSFFIELEKYLRRDNSLITPSVVADCAEFFSIVDQVDDNFEADTDLKKLALNYSPLIKSATNDRSTRVNRGKIIQSVFDYYINSEKLL